MIIYLINKAVATLRQAKFTIENLYGGRFLQTVQSSGAI